MGIEINEFNGSDTEVNIDGMLNGIVTEKPAVEFYESAGTIYVEITNSTAPTHDLPFLLDGMKYELNTTTGGGPNGGAFVALTAGADANTGTGAYADIRQRSHD